VIGRLFHISRPVLWINTVGPAVVGLWLTGDLWRWEVLPLLVWLTLAFNLLIYGVNDVFRLESILMPGKKLTRKKRTCSGVAIYTARKEDLPERIGNHSVVLPSKPAALYRSLEAGEEPEEAMAFVDYYRPGEPYSNEKSVLALGLTMPANGREYGLESAFVMREMERVGGAIGLPRPVDEYFGEYEILHPRYFGGWRSASRALLGRSDARSVVGRYISPGTLTVGGSGCGGSMRRFIQAVGCPWCSTRL
jgi:hypothetical protein